MCEPCLQMNTSDGRRGSCKISRYTQLDNWQCLCQCRTYYKIPRDRPVNHERESQLSPRLCIVFSNTLSLLWHGRFQLGRFRLIAQYMSSQRCCCLDVSVRPCQKSSHHSCRHMHTRLALGGLLGKTPCSSHHPRRLMAHHGAALSLALKSYQGCWRGCRRGLSMVQGSY